MDTRRPTEKSTNRRTFFGGAAAVAACSTIPRDIRGADGPRPNFAFDFDRAMNMDNAPAAGVKGRR